MSNELHVYRSRSFFDLQPMSSIVSQFQTISFIQMLRLTLSLFTQVRNLGPHGPIVLQIMPLSSPFLYGNYVNCIVWKLYQLYNFKTVEGIFMKLYTNIKH